MKVAYLEAPHKLYVKELPDPVLTAGHALIEIELCGVCGTEIGGYKGVSPVIQYPVVGVGHEAAGTIVQVGPNDRGLAAGDRVCLEPYTSCGVCYACRLGRYNNCEKLQTCGVHRPGMMATLFSHPVGLIHKLPDQMSWEQGAMVEPLTIGIHANHRAGVKAGEYVLVVGAGSIGMLVAMAARAYGAIPILADPVPERLEICRGLGLTRVCDNLKEDLPAFLRNTCDGALPQVVIDCSGAGPALERLADWVRHAGRIVFVGWPKGSSPIDVTWYMRKELDLFGSRNSNGEFPESIELIRSGKIEAAKLITSIVPLDQAPELIKSLAETPGDNLKGMVRVKG
ncbi:MAG: alcohol dehydrogenase catalytic domain-containing protein [Planctomycetes bacterium]|nr:alcohol dehydrogenase catalytic domain-containing protein [Planctomycetota bacterium]